MEGKEPFGTNLEEHWQVEGQDRRQQGRGGEEGGFFDATPRPGKDARQVRKRPLQADALRKGGADALHDLREGFEGAFAELKAAVARPWTNSREASGGQGETFLKKSFPLDPLPKIRRASRPRSRDITFSEPP
jgi:hypothetical protein